MVADVLAAMQTEEAAKIAAELEVARLHQRATASEVCPGLDRGVKFPALPLVLAHIIQ